MFGKSGKQLGQFGWIHEIACPSRTKLYVAELLNWRAQKILWKQHTDPLLWTYESQFWTV